MQEPRWKLIAHIREQIEAGTYATEAKLRCCLDRLIVDLTGGPAPHTVLPHQEAASDRPDPDADHPNSHPS